MLQFDEGMGGMLSGLEGKHIFQTGSLTPPDLTAHPPLLADL